MKQPPRSRLLWPNFSCLRLQSKDVITVLLFASVADKAGTRRLEIPVQDGETVAHVRDRLVERFPQLEPMVPNLLFALDEEYVRTTEPIRAGQTLAVIPPVSGGC